MQAHVFENSFICSNAKDEIYFNSLKMQTTLDKFY